MLASYQLSVPNTAASPGLVHAFVHRLTVSTGLDESDAAALAEAARIAVEYVVLNDYPDNQDDELHTFCDLTADEFVFRLADCGVPSYPTELSPAMKAAFACVDSYEWTLRGYLGKQLVLRKKLRQQPLAEVLARGAQMKRPSVAQPVDAADYRIRRFEPADAPAIAELVYRTYGTTYDDEDYYYPDRIRNENATGAMVSVVAVHPEGEIVGHYALEQRDMAGIYEGSSAVVNPLHRGRKLLDNMKAFACEEARTLGMRGLIFLPWTVHVFSQKANEHFGTHLMAVNLGDSVPITLAGIETDETRHRVSTLLYFVALQPRAASVLHVPQRHQAWVEELLGPIQGVRFEGAEPAQTDTGTVLRTKALPHDHFAEIFIDRIGGDAWTALEHEVRRLLVHEKMETIFLNLPMAEPTCPALAERAETLGFGFIGVGPSYCAESDALRLALLSEPLDGALIHVYSPLARRLLDHVLAEQVRVVGVSL